ncbi:hypothetical protein GUITHDRAFT_103649 [Guillardia theta CCMP2712]|uniref:Uncharacterized protein n=1 Tax=Guillardia theta (strain CCMP2712) TaxID=905079 RepID=L1JQF4_GUITC|nr:hypothetical protein GUITHDRAFT_103649 [Guillardia theta CCMP2712]EKX50415.1 hypothetical protein GUITHDRAFT_103649 [Guillardia theta CCMP2712]|eukprot:XP_005837395.1 hypothetical protein GUITHDRAFT_103649 [Guillardia theta CCMP2712]
MADKTDKEVLGVIGDALFYKAAEPFAAIGMASEVLKKREIEIAGLALEEKVQTPPASTAKVPVGRSAAAAPSRAPAPARSKVTAATAKPPTAAVKAPAKTPAAAAAARPSPTKAVASPKATAAKVLSAAKEAPKTAKEEATAGASVPGQLVDTLLDFVDGKPEGMARLAFKFRCSMDLSAGDCIVITLPDFEGDQSTPILLDDVAGKPMELLSASWLVCPPRVELKVPEEKVISKDTLVEIASREACVRIPMKGITEDSKREFLVSASCKQGQVPPSPVLSVCSIRGCQLSADLQRALVYLGCLLVESGPRGSRRKTYRQAAFSCFNLVLRDAHLVEGREGLVLLAASARELALLFPNVFLDARTEGKIYGGMRDLAGDLREVDPIFKVEEAEETSDPSELVASWRKAAEKACSSYMGWKESLCAEERIILLRKSVATENFKEAMAMLKELETQYLSAVNSKSSIDRVRECLTDMASVFDDAAVEILSQQDELDNMHCCLGHVREEAKHLHSIYGSPGQDGKSSSRSAEKDSANLDEIKAILKNRGVFGSVSIDEQLKELEEEYHDNVQFGLQLQADTVALLLEWYREYRTNMERGGEFYSKQKEEESQDVVMYSKELNEAMEEYRKGLKRCKESSQVEGKLLFAAGRVKYFLGALDDAIETLERCCKIDASDLGGSLYLGLCYLAKEEAFVRANLDKIERCMEKSILAMGSQVDLLMNGDSTCLQQYELLSDETVRISNPDVQRGSVEFGIALMEHGRTAKAITMLEISIKILSNIANLGLCQQTQSESKVLKMRAEAHLIQAYKKSNKHKTAFDMLKALNQTLSTQVEKNAASIETRLRNAELAVAMASSRADVHEFLGHALLDMYEHHPGHRSDAALLQQAEESFRRSLLLEGKPFQPLTDQLEGVTAKPTSTASKAPLKTPSQSVGRGKGKPENVVKGGAKSPASKPANASTGNAKEKAEEGDDRKEEKLVNPRSCSSRIGLAKVLTEKGGDPTAFPPDLIASVTSLYEESIEINPRDFEAYFKIGELLDLKDPKRAAAIYSQYPVNFDSPNHDDAFVAGEVVRLSMRGKDYTKWSKGSPELVNVGKSLVVMARVQSLEVIRDYVEKLEVANHTQILCEVFAEVNRKSVDDPDMRAHFARKGWIVGPETLKAAMDAARAARPL